MHKIDKNIPINDFYNLDLSTGFQWSIYIETRVNKNKTVYFNPFASGVYFNSTCLLTIILF